MSDVESFFEDITQNKVVGDLMEHIDTRGDVLYGIQMLFHTHFDPSLVLVKTKVDGVLIDYIPVAKASDAIH